MSYFDDKNPYNIIDGPWGGMGIATWFDDVDPQNPKDVYELDWIVDFDYSETEEKWTYFYSRFYDYSEKVWKPTNSSNDKKHIVFKPKRKLPDKILLPRINRTFPELNISDILQCGTMQAEPAINSNFYITLTYDKTND